MAEDNLQERINSMCIAFDDLRYEFEKTNNISLKLRDRFFDLELATKHVENYRQKGVQKFDKR